MNDAMGRLKDIIEDGKRIRDKYPSFKDCKILKMIEELEAELEVYLQDK